MRELKGEKLEAELNYLKVEKKVWKKFKKKNQRMDDENHR